MDEKPLILLCDDDAEMLKSVELSLRPFFTLHTASSVVKAKKLSQSKIYDAAVIDLHFEGQEQDGIDLLDHFTKHSPETFLIILSGDSSTKRVVSAMRRKHFEFVTKDGDYFEPLMHALKNAMQLKKAKAEQSIQKYLTVSPKVQEVLHKAELILKSPSTAPILILGETGSGKELLAKHIAHKLHSKMVSVNMGGIPKEMAESILFGHERGAFTGPISNKVGLIETANDGLFFMDEIGECSPSIQVKLLRVLQEKEVQPLGSNKTRKIHTRFIAATHCDLVRMVEEGSFRLDWNSPEKMDTGFMQLKILRTGPVS